ncbi:lectin subunit alpha-like [Musca vetustissima]|uniref:lectin subunit alpha-like n=1 Tax=Musca vetustissima TaxID=27455 RepID=UPI002AB64FB5|nr:lectin subunit alpha-like [Musca vetustissima]
MAGKFVVGFAIFAVVFLQLAAAADWYTGSDGRNYLIEGSASYTWFQAMDQCSRRGLQLVMIDNEVKNNAIIDLIKIHFGKSRDLWIGHHDEFNSKKDKTRTWYSVATGSPIAYSNWNKGEPNNYKGNEHCTEISVKADFKWNDEKCDENYYGFICEEHYKTTQCHNDVQTKRYAANEKNSKLAADFSETQQNIQTQLIESRNDTDQQFVNWEKSSDEVFENFKKSLDDYLKKKPYLMAVVADIGDDINALAMEAKNEIAKLTQETQQSIVTSQLNGEQLVNNETSAFAEKIKIHNNEVDSLMSY